MKPMPEHLAKIKGYAEHQAWLKQTYDYCRHDPGDAKPVQMVCKDAYLRDFDFSYADIRGASFFYANCCNAVFICANCRNTRFISADLSGADLRWTDMRGANLRDTDFSGADLGGTDLRDAYISGANMRDADFSGADLYHADLGDADFRGTFLRDANLSGVYLHNAKGITSGGPVGRNRRVIFAVDHGTEIIFYVGCRVTSPNIIIAAIENDYEPGKMRDAYIATVRAMVATLEAQR